MSVQVKPRSRFKYMVDDRVRVIATERTGVVEDCNPDPGQPPYLVRLDPRSVAELQQPERAAFQEQALERNLSAAFTVVFGEGVRDVYDRVLKRLEAVRTGYVALAAGLEEAAERRAKASQMADSFWQSLTFLVMRASAHDGPLHLSPDSYAGDCLSLLFRYERSGYEGGLIFRAERTGSGDERDPLLGEWETHS
jgi:hypothetical protein